MSESIHGHQVMEMMATSGKSYTKDELKADIAVKFGGNVRFHVCMDDDLTADDLIEFLESKGKFVASEQGISMPKDHLC